MARFDSRAAQLYHSTHTDCMIYTALLPLVLLSRSFVRVPWAGRTGSPYAMQVCAIARKRGGPSSGRS